MKIEGEKTGKLASLLGVYSTVVNVLSTCYVCSDAADGGGGFMMRARRPLLEVHPGSAISSNSNTRLLTRLLAANCQ